MHADIVVAVVVARRACVGRIIIISGMVGDAGAEER